MIDFNKFDFPSIFGVVKSTDGLKRQQTRPLRAEVQEIAIAKYSGDQLKYVGDTENGRDFLGIHDGLYYESKGMDRLFQKRTPYTREITLKNYHTNKTGLPEKTFDYMLLWDTENYTAGICSWDSCMKKKNIKLKAAGVKFKVHYNDITFIANNVIPKGRDDFGAKLTKLIEESV